MSSDATQVATLRACNACTDAITARMQNLLGSTSSAIQLNTAAGWLPCSHRPPAATLSAGGVPLPRALKTSSAYESSGGRNYLHQPAKLDCSACHQNIAAVSSRPQSHMLGSATISTSPMAVSKTAWKCGCTDVYWSREGYQRPEQRGASRSRSNCNIMKRSSYLPTSPTCMASLAPTCPLPFDAPRLKMYPFLKTSNGPRILRPSPCIPPPCPPVVTKGSNPWCAAEASRLSQRYQVQGPMHRWKL